MKERAIQLAEGVRTGHIQRHEAWITLTTMIMKSLEYPLAATTLSEAECTEIMWIILKETLPKTGINRYICRDVLYGTKHK